MKDLVRFPKSIKKAVRYIIQNKSKESLEEIRELIDYTFKLRRVRLN